MASRISGLPTWRRVLLTSLGLMAVAMLPLPAQARHGGYEEHQHPAGNLNGRAKDTDAAARVSEGLPSMHLLMKPLYTEAPTRREPIAIHVTMNLTSPTKRFTPEQPLLALPLKVVAVPTARYDAETNPVAARDAHGNPIRLSYRDEDPEAGPRLWYLEEERPGTDTGVVLTFTAPHRVTDETTLPGPRVELRRDVSGGGLVGQGMGFLPTPPPPAAGTEGGEPWQEPWNVTLEWDLGGSPAGVHGAWSLGDGDAASAVGPLDKLIYHAIFAVGYLQRYPPWTVDLAAVASASRPGGVYAAYWLEPSPYNLTVLAQKAEDIYAGIASYFDSSTDPFRVFFRRIEANSGGTGATYSFLLEYSGQSAAYTSDLDMAGLLAHEAVHEFALLDPPRRTPLGWLADEAAWYDEGVASWVGDLAGLLGAPGSGSGSGSGAGAGAGGDAVGRRGFVESMNDHAQAYYTAPAWALEMGFGEVLERYWDELDITRVPYWRGFMFLAQLDGLIWSATDGASSMDEVIVELYKLRRDGRPCALDHLKDMVAGLIGREAFDRAYAGFFEGDLIVPPANSLERYGLKLVKKHWHRFELGIDTRSLRLFKVQGLVKGSNADKAGVREGDVIVRGYMVWVIQDTLKEKMKMTVLRDGRELELEWWPRSDEVVEAYGWVDVRGEQAPDEL